MVKETETDVDSKAKAEHTLFAGSDNSEAESEEQARGIGYKILENGKSFAWHYDEANDLERVMLACFGAKTLATNVTSGVRNNKKNPGSADAQYDELVERFEGLRNGQWVDRTREPGAPRVDKDALAKAIVQVMVDSGKIAADAVDATTVEKRARLDSDAAYLPFVRTNAAVASAYAAIIGKKVATADDL